MNKNQRSTDKKSFFTIGAKLVLIISALVLLSLGSITALVSYLVTQDLRVTAEAGNFEVNRRSALEAENAFANIRANTLVLVQLAISNEQAHLRSAAVDIFFGQNPHIAALAFNNQLFTNNNFFTSKEIDIALAEAWRQRHTTPYLLPANYYLKNESPYFGLSLLTYAFPLAKDSIAVLFSADSLTDSFGFGTNQSYIVNGEDDILLHSDFVLVRTGANFMNDSFIQYMRRSPQRSLQTMYTDKNQTRYFGAFTKLNIDGMYPQAAIITNIEYDKVFEGIRETTRRNIYLTIAVLSISIMLIWFFAKTISSPLKNLAAAARQIEGGDFELSLKPKGKRTFGSDEIGILTASFQKMSGALGIFGKFTNKEIALLAMRGQIKPGGLSKHATIFFSDIRNFTAMSEEFTKEFADEASDKIVFWLNEYLTAMVECVEKTDGTIDKFIGDAVMAHWGTATTSGNPKQDALNCITAALMMRAAVHKMNKQRRPGDKSDPMINIGCGINTGMVTAGQIGSDQRMEYTVIGDAVNLASRVESLCKELHADILISESTWRMVKNHIICEELPAVSVKGKSKPVRIFAVINLASNPKGPKTLAQVRKILGIEQ